MNTSRRTATPVVLNPHLADHERVTTQLMYKYHDYLKDIKTDWKVITDSYGNDVAIVPCWHIVFKDGSDYRLDLQNAAKKSATPHNVH